MISVEQDAMYLCVDVRSMFTNFLKMIWSAVVTIEVANEIERNRMVEWTYGYLNHEWRKCSNTINTVFLAQ